MRDIFFAIIAALCVAFVGGCESTPGVLDGDTANLATEVGVEYGAAKWARRNPEHARILLGLLEAKDAAELVAAWIPDGLPAEDRRLIERLTEAWLGKLKTPPVAEKYRLALVSGVKLGLEANK